ncbi:hypothetical protein IAT38_003520 [Cryptococcus sp. DSM 104549]
MTTPAQNQLLPSQPSQAPRTSLLQNLTTQSFLLNHLFSLLASPPSASAAQSGQSPNISQVHAALQLSALDLSALVKEVEVHQDAWRRLVEKRKEVEGLERRVRGLVRRLEEGRVELEEMVEKGKKVQADIERSERDPVRAKPLLAHAQALARHSSAPVSGLLAHVDRAQHVPWPTEMSMRMGLLFQLEGSMSGMGEKGVVGDEQQVTAPRVEQRREEVQQEEPSRRYDPNAVFQLDLNSDDSDDD